MLKHNCRVVSMTLDEALMLKHNCRVVSMTVDEALR